MGIRRTDDWVDLQVQRTLHHGTTTIVYEAVATAPAGPGRVVLRVPYGPAYHQAVLARMQALVGPLAHPQLPRLVGRAAHDGEVGHVYRWAGVDLQTWLDAGGGGAGALDVAVAIAAQVAGALAALHAAGLTHGAIRPEHVLVAEDGAVTLTGLGWARAAGSPRPEDPDEDDPERDPDPWVARAMRYAGPELLAGSAVAASDVWATALLACELQGAHPLPRDAEAIESAAAIHAGLDVPAALPPALREVLRLALARDPARRPTAVALRDALLAVGAALGLATTPAVIAAAIAPAPAAARKRCWCVHLSAGLDPGVSGDELDEHVRELERVQRLFSTSQHYGDVELLRCARCGGPLLELFVEHEGFSGSRHRYLTPLTTREWDALLAGHPDPDTCEDWVGDRCGIYVVGGRAHTFRRARVGYLGIDHRLLP